MSILTNRKISFKEIDISDPLSVSEKNFMREHSEPAGSDPTPLPPQIFNDDVYCGVLVTSEDVMFLPLCVCLSVSKITKKLVNKFL